jgi:hypothetical protein
VAATKWRAAAAEAAAAAEDMGKAGGHYLGDRRSTVPPVGKTPRNSTPVGPDIFCSCSHPTRFEPSFRELNCFL